MSKYKQIDLAKIKTISIEDRKSKVKVEDFAKIYDSTINSFDSFIESFPNILASKDLKEFAKLVANAFLERKPIILLMGAHLIKVGLNPIIIDLIKNNIISCIGMNGAGVIHDVELSLWGKTSENVEENLQNGTFGMCAETAEFINTCLVENHHNSQMGYGESIGKKINKDMSADNNISLLAQAYNYNIPVTVHVGIGTDIIYQHPNMDGSAAGELSYRDFKVFCNVLKQLGNGGIVINIGSAVILPEVFLKALTVVRNLDYDVHNFITAAFDMNHQYRSKVNIVQRPTQKSGKGFYFIGHHEIMIPLIIAMIKNEIKKLNGR